MDGNKVGFITLGIETSCDDTAIAITADGSHCLACAISSQIDAHSVYGGVVPELASRMHQEAIIPLLKKVMSEAGVTKEDIDLIAVTSGPGLIGSLMVGVMTAKALSQGWHIPVIGVNHLEGHIFANTVELSGSGMQKAKPPFISLIVSGGHTELVYVKDFGSYELLGTTRDDAAGEAFDKVSKILGLGYPGGPVIDRFAQQGNADAFALPIPLSGTKEIEYSFSGLKTSAVSLVEKLRTENGRVPMEDICASFQKAVIETIMVKLKLAIKRTGIKRLTLSGGVAANSGLRSALEEYAKAHGIELYLPARSLCTDNGVMIAAAGYSSYMRGNRSDMTLSPNPSWEIW